MMMLDADLRERESKSNTSHWSAGAGTVTVAPSGDPPSLSLAQWQSAFPFSPHAKPVSKAMREAC